MLRTAMVPTSPSVYSIGESSNTRIRDVTSRSWLRSRYHDPEANLEEGLATLKRCIDEVSKRLVVAPGKYKVKVVDKDGVREVEL